MSPQPEELENCKILITGPTSQVGVPLALHLAGKNEVHGIARFKDEATKAPLAAAGIHCIALDLAEDGLDALSEDYDYVLNLAVVKSGDWEYDMAANVQGVGRLIRSQTDSGIIAILDSLIVTKRYGETFLKSLWYYCSSF